MCLNILEHFKMWRVTYIFDVLIGLDWSKTEFEEMLLDVLDTTEAGAIITDFDRITDLWKTCICSVVKY